MSFFTELKRRNVIRVLIAYVVIAWGTAQVLQLVFLNFVPPAWVMRTILVLLAIGLPFAALFAWIFELTPEGIKREHVVDSSRSITAQTGKKLNIVIYSVLVASLSYFAYDKFVLSTARQAAQVEAMAQAVTEPAVAEQDNSIAVLPFVNMSDDPGNEYFSDGLSEELLNLLAKIPELHVAARTSSFAFKGQNLGIPDIAQRLRVGHVLEGSVRKAGDQVRITAQLIKADDGYHLWSETYDRTLDNIFVIQDEIASAVVEQLKISLLGDAPTARETDPEGYAIYLQARQLGRHRTVESLENSNALYEQVLALDPGYAAAWSGLSENYSQQAFGNLRPHDEGLALARESANKALAIDPEYAPAHANLGLIAMFSEHELAEAALHLEHALELEPQNTDILLTAVALYKNLGRLDRAIALSEYIVTLDPVNNNAYYTLGSLNRFSGELDAAITALQTALSLSPGRISLQNVMGEALLLKGEPEAALKAIQQEQSSWRLISLPMVYHALGRADDSDAALVELIEALELEAAYNIAYVLAYRGEVEQAFEWLDKAVQYNDPGLSELPVEPFFANIDDDPRWLSLLERLGKSPAQLDAVKFEVELRD